MNPKKNNSERTKPIFIIGNPRSGTTLIRLMLTNHQNIVIPPECGFAVWWYKKYKDVDFLEGRNAEEIRNFVRDLMTSKKIETWKLREKALYNFILGEKPSTYAELVSLVYKFYGKTLGRTFTRWGDKNNFYIQHVDELIELFHDPFFIHIVRDGRDVACSYIYLNQLNIKSKYAPSLPFKVTEIATEWQRNLTIARNSFESICWKNVLEVRYEDLVRDPVKELKRICYFLSEKYDRTMLDYYVQNRLLEQEPKEFLQWNSKTLGKPVSTEIGKYRSCLTPKENEDFEKIAGHLLRRYNYL